MAEAVDNSKLKALSNSLIDRIIGGDEVEKFDILRYIRAGRYEKEYIESDEQHYDAMRQMLLCGDKDCYKYAAMDIFKNQIFHVRDIINKTYGTELWDYEDLLCEGYWGAVDGVKTYDSTKGKPSTYLHRAILDKVSTLYNRNRGFEKSHSYELREILRVQEEYRSVQGKEPTYTDIAIALNKPESFVKARLDEARQNVTVSIDDENFKEDSVLTEYETSPEQLMINRAENEALYDAMDRILNPLQQKIIHCWNVLEYSDDETAKTCNITITQVRTQRTLALRKLRADKSLRRMFPSLTKNEVKKEEKALTIDTAAAYNVVNVLSMIGDQMMDIVPFVDADMQSDTD